MEIIDRIFKGTRARFSLIFTSNNCIFTVMISNAQISSQGTSTWTTVLSFIAKNEHLEVTNSNKARKKRLKRTVIRRLRLWVKLKSCSTMSVIGLSGKTKIMMMNASLSKSLATWDTIKANYDRMFPLWNSIILAKTRASSLCTLYILDFEYIELNTASESESQQADYPVKTYRQRRQIPCIWPVGSQRDYMISESKKGLNSKVLQFFWFTTVQ